MKTVIHIKTDKEVKERAQRLAAELGLPLSTVVNSYLRQFVRNREVHVSAAPRMTPLLEARIKKAEADLRRERNISPPLTTPEAMERYLRTTRKR